MKITNSGKSCIVLFGIGLLVGIICRLTDLFPYESLWSLSSMATMLGFWIASVGVITWLSSSSRGAFLHSFLYMLGMTVSFYGQKYLLGLFSPAFSNDGFQTKLFLMYTAGALVCGIGSAVLFLWNKKTALASFLCAMPAAGMAAEAIGCICYLVCRRMLLAQAIFDFAFALVFGIGLWKKASNKIVYLVSLICVAALVFFVLYRPSL